MGKTNRGGNGRGENRNRRGGNSELKEIAVVSEYLESFDPKLKIKNAEDKVAEATDLALKETPELIPEGATPVQEAQIEASDADIKALAVTTHEAFTKLTNELGGEGEGVPEIKTDQADQSATREYKDLSVEEKKSKLALYLQTFVQVAEVAFETRKATTDSQLKSILNEAITTAEEKSGIPATSQKDLLNYLSLLFQDIRNGEDLSKLSFGNMIERLPYTLDDRKEAYIDLGQRTGAIINDILNFSKTSISHERTSKKGERIEEGLSVEKQFEKLFTDRLRQELKTMEADTSDQSLDNTYSRVLDAVFDNFNAELPRHNSNFNSDFTTGEDYGKYVKKISRDQARDIARRVNDQLKREWRIEKGFIQNDATEEIIKKVNKLEFTVSDTVGDLDKKEPEAVDAPSADTRLTENPEHIEARPTPTDIKIDPAKIKPGFTIVWGNGQSAQVTRTTAKTVFYQNPEDTSKKSKVPINKITAVKDESGAVVMGEGTGEPLVVEGGQKNILDEIKLAIQTDIDHSLLKSSIDIEQSLQSPESILPSLQEHRNAMEISIKRIQELNSYYSSKYPHIIESIAHRFDSVIAEQEVLFSSTYNDVRQVLENFGKKENQVSAARAIEGKDLSAEFLAWADGQMARARAPLQESLTLFRNHYEQLAQRVARLQAIFNSIKDLATVDQSVADKLIFDALNSESIVDVSTDMKDQGTEEVVTEDPSPLLDQDALDKLMAEAIGEGATETDTKQEISPKDILNKIEEISLGVKFDIDKNLKKVEDSTKLQELLDSFGTDLDTNSADDLNSKLKKLEILQSVLLEEFANKKTFDFASFNNIYESRLALEGGQADSNDAVAPSAEQVTDGGFSQEEFDAILGAAISPIEQAEKIGEATDGVITQNEIDAISAVAGEAKGEKEGVVEEAPLTSEEVEKIVQEIQTLPYTDAAGKEVELKVGDELYQVYPLNLSIGTFEIKGLRSDGHYLEESPFGGDSWSKLRTSYYTSLEDAQAEIDRLKAESEALQVDTLPFTDAAGKEVELKVGDKLYYVLDLDFSINAHEIKGLRSDNYYLEESPFGDDSWSELWTSYYTSLEDAQAEIDRLKAESEALQVDTLPYTDAAGKEVELKVGDELYQVYPFNLSIGTFEIKGLRSDGHYLEESPFGGDSWSKLRTSYYTSLEDAQAEVDRLKAESEALTISVNVGISVENAGGAVDQVDVPESDLATDAKPVAIDILFEQLHHIPQFVSPEDALALNQLQDRYEYIKNKISTAKDSERKKIESELIFMSEELALIIERNKGRSIGPENHSFPNTSELEGETFELDEGLAQFPPEAEVQEEFEKLSSEEQKEISWAVRNIGFIAKEKKSNFFASLCNKLSSDKNSAGRFMSALAQTYERDAENAHRLIELAEERKDTGSKFGLAKSGAMSVATTIGIVAKFGRTVSDLTGASLASPLRYVMMSAMGTARLSEAGKEARISTLAEKNPNIIHQTDWEDLMHNWIAFQEEFKDSGKTEEQLLEDFRTLAVATDLRERIKVSMVGDEPMPSELTGLVKITQIGERWEGATKLIKDFFQLNIINTIGELQTSLDAIDKNPRLTTDLKVDKKLKVIKKYTHLFKDLEHIADECGEIDALAMGLKYMEKGSKAVVVGMTVETLLLSTDAVYDSIVGITKKSAEFITEVKADIAQQFDARNAEPVIASGSIKPQIDGVAPILSIQTPNIPLPISGNTVEIQTAPAFVPETNTVPETTSTPIAAPEKIPAASTPTEVAPTPPANPIEDFTKDHTLYQKTGAEITSSANGIKIEYEIGGDKGDFATLDQALRRVVAQEIPIGTDGKFDAIEATRAENVLANLRQLLEGKAVGDIKPVELSGIAEFKDGKLTILDYRKFDDFMSEKLFTRAAEKISEANIDTGYARTSIAKWQEIFDQRGEKTSVDFGSTNTEPIVEKLEAETPSVSSVVPSNVDAIDKSLESQLLGNMPDSNIDSNPKLMLGEMGDIDASLESQLLEKMPASRIEARPLKEIVIDSTPYPVEYMRDVFEKMSPDQSSALAEVMREAKIDGEKWEDINFIIDGNTDLLRNADGKFDVNQVELALELSNTPRPKPAELRIALEAMKVLDIEQAQEVAIVQAIMNPKEGPKALEKLFGESGDNRGAKVTLNPRRGILHFENLGPQKLDGNMNFREGFVRIGKRAGAVFGGKFPLKNLVQAINSFK